MSNDKEIISAYLDDGLSPEELDVIGPVESASEFGAASRYQIMGEALRGQLSDAVMIDISTQVREALQNEEIHEDIKAENIKAAERPVKQAIKQPGQPMFNFSAWFRPLGGLAVAASVVMVMVVMVRQVESPSGNGDLVADAGNSTVNISGSVIVSTPVAVAIEDTQIRSRPAVNFDAYLAEHAEFAAQDTLQGRMPYARAVSYKSQ